ncbi:MAG: PLDc N-terminal domain-containing protein, partial [Schleiferiaceae bacterium]|nr:PLDc N-terminal domain-containing protein [Schleiferiaceae bacterium]
MIQDFIPNYLLYFYYGAIALLIFSIVLDNRNPSKTTGYVLLLIFVPIVGVLIYFYFGRNYRKRKLFNRKGFTDNLLLLRWKKERETLFDEQEKSIESDSGEAYPVIKLLQNNNALLTHNNYVKLLTNGEEKFEDLIESIRNASHHIHLEYYIIEEDPLTRKLFDALIEKEKAEVEVRIIYDGVGSKLSNSFLRKIKNAGIEIHPFMPVRFPYFTS